MRYEKYQLFAIKDEEYASFDFTSDEPRGAVNKRIIFLPTENPEMFNLAFGDLEPGSEVLDDKVVTNNGDRDKVLATIAEVINIYTKKYPKRWILIKGSTEARNRLYRMVIALNLKELLKTFDIFGVTEADVVLQFVNDNQFHSFLIKRRN